MIVVKKIVFIFACFIFVYSVSLQVYTHYVYPSQSTLTQPLEEIVPGGLEGWRVTSMPIAQSKDLQEWTEKLLQYDDAVLRLFEKKNLRILVYVAYWQPGKKPYTMVGTHNPDSCWVNSGWQRQKRIYSWQPSLKGQSLKPCEYGVYHKDGENTEVIFWHLVGDETNNYRQKVGWRNGLQGRIERLPLFLKDLKNYGLDQQREQFFIRISSNVPFEQIWDDPSFLELIESLSSLDIFC